MINHMDERNKNIQISKLCIYAFSLLISSHNRGENRHTWKYGLKRQISLNNEFALKIRWSKRIIVIPLKNHLHFYFSIFSTLLVVSDLKSYPKH